MNDVSEEKLTPYKECPICGKLFKGVCKDCKNKYEEDEYEEEKEL